MSKATEKQKENQALAVKGEVRAFTEYASWEDWYLAVNQPPKAQPLITNGRPQTRQDKTGQYVPVMFLPIDILEAELDAVFGGAAWSFVGDFEVIPFQVGVDKKQNPLVMCKYTGVLTYRHPITREKVERTGTVSNTVSRGTADKKGSALKAFALKNAASGIGERFGRSLNRDELSTYTQEVATDQAEDYRDTIAGATSIAELQEIQKGAPDYLSKRPEFRALLNARVKELQAPKKGGKDA